MGTPLKVSLGAVLGLGLCACSLFAKKSSTPTVDGCPTSTEQVGQISWGLVDPDQMTAKTGLLAALHIDRLAGGMNEELIDACGALARQLFADEKALTPEMTVLGAEADQACKVVDESVKKLKSIAGGRVIISAGVPLCSTPLGVADECLAACRSEQEKADPKAAGPIPALSCEGEMSGTCAGMCSGQCTAEGDSECAGACAGLCAGSCDSEFTGTCSETCAGRCDGVEVKGPCEGTCQGQCLDGARGTCGGTCTGACDGSCTVEAQGKCDGVCAGECNQALTSQRCTGYLRLPGNVNDCQKGCDLAVLAGLTCTAPVVKVRVEEPENEEAAGLLERALSQHLPQILAARALNLEQARVEQAAALAKEDMARLATLRSSSTVQLAEKNKVCIDEAKRNGDESSAALALLFSAATTAQVATASD
jgi:hypothetical protein